jgi:hypothetical protein
MLQNELCKLFLQTGFLSSDDLQRSNVKVPAHDTCINNANIALRDLSLHDDSPFAEHVHISHRTHLQDNC